MNNTPPPGQISMPGMAPQQPQPQLLKSYAPQTPPPGQISIPGIAQQQQAPPPFQQGYPPQTPPPGYAPPGYAPQPSGQLQQPMPQPARQKEQEVKFYKSGLFGISSAGGQFQRDSRGMIQHGWRVTHIMPIGVNFFLQRLIAVVYER